MNIIHKDLQMLSHTVRVNTWLNMSQHNATSTQVLNTHLQMESFLYNYLFCLKLKTHNIKANNCRSPIWWKVCFNASHVAGWVNLVDNVQRWSRSVCYLAWCRGYPLATTLAHFQALPVYWVILIHYCFPTPFASWSPIYMLFLGRRHRTSFSNCPTYMSTKLSRAKVSELFSLNEIYEKCTSMI
jgi:hypothetical protein